MKKNYDSPLFFTPFPELKTKRLILRQLVGSDADKLFSLRSDEGVNRYIDRPKEKNIEETRRFMARINHGISQDQWIYWVITLKTSPKPIGTLCLWNFSDTRTSAEIGYELSPRYQGRGIMDEALKRVLVYGFKTLKLERIDAYTHRDNSRSTGLLLKNGFEPDPERKDRKHRNTKIFTVTSL